MNTVGKKEPTIAPYLRFFYIVVVTAFVLSLTNIIEMTFIYIYEEQSTILSVKQLTAGTFIFPVEIVRIEMPGDEPFSVYTNFCFNACLTYILYGIGILAAIVFGRRKCFGKIINCIALILSGLCFIGSGLILLFFEKAIMVQLTDPVLKILFDAGNLFVKTLPIAYISGGISIFAGIGFILGIFPALKQYKVEE